MAQTIDLSSLKTELNSKLQAFSQDIATIVSNTKSTLLKNNPTTSGSVTTNKKIYSSNVTGGAPTNPQSSSLSSALPFIAMGAILLVAIIAVKK